MSLCGIGFYKIVLHPKFEAGAAWPLVLTVPVGQQGHLVLCWWPDFSLWKLFESSLSPWYSELSRGSESYGPSFTSLIMQQRVFHLWVCTSEFSSGEFSSTVPLTIFSPQTSLFPEWTSPRRWILVSLDWSSMSPSFSLTMSVSF